MFVMMIPYFPDKTFVTIYNPNSDKISANVTLRWFLGSLDKDNDPDKSMLDCPPYTSKNAFNLIYCDKSK